MNSMFAVLANEVFSNVLEGLNSKISRWLRLRVQNLFSSVWLLP